MGRLNTQLQVAHLERALGRHGITDAGISDYVDSSLTYSENLEAVERATGMRLHRWTDGEIRAAVEAAEEHAEIGRKHKDTYRAGTAFAVRLRQDQSNQFAEALLRSGLSKSEFVRRAILAYRYHIWDPRRLRKQGPSDPDPMDWWSDEGRPAAAYRDPRGDALLDA